MSNAEIMGLVLPVPAEFIPPFYEIIEHLYAGHLSNNEVHAATVRIVAGGNIPALLKSLITLAELRAHVASGSVH